MKISWVRNHKIKSIALCGAMIIRFNLDSRVRRTLVSEGCSSPSTCPIVLENLMSGSESVSEASILV